MPPLKAISGKAKNATDIFRKGEPLSRVQSQSIYKSNERVADDDLESNNESETDSKSKIGPGKAAVAMPNTNGQKLKRKASSSTSSNNGDEGESASEAGDQTSTTDDGESGSGSESDTRSERESSRETNSTAASERSRSVPSQGQPSSQSVSPKVIAPYSPPTGFAEALALSGGQSKASEVFSPVNLAGKQIWYITAPKSVPIGAVKKASLQNVQLGKPVLCLNGQEYGFVQDQVDNISHTKLMVPDDNNNRLYRTGKNYIDRTLHLQRIIQLPDINYQKDPQGTSADIHSVLVKKHVMQQPKGLRMRFRPTGFGQGKTGTIGSTSPSYTSDSSESSRDDRPKDTIPKRKRPFTFHTDYSTLKGTLSKPPAKGGPLKSSGSMTGVLAPISEPDRSSEAESTRDSGTSSESSGEEEDAHLAVKDFAEPSQPTLKRKLSDFKGNSSQSSKVNGAKSKRLHEIPAVKLEQLSSRKQNDVLKGSMPPIPASSLSRHVTDSPPALLRPSAPILPPPRFPTHASKKGSFPVPSPVSGKKQQTVTHTEIPQIKGELPSANTEVTPKTARVPIKEKSISRPGMREGESLGDRIKGIDPGLNGEQRQKELKRLQTNEQSRISHAKRGKSAANATPVETVIRPPPKPSVHKALPQEMEKAVTRDIIPQSSTPKRKRSKKSAAGVAVEQKGEASMKDQKVPAALPTMTRGFVPKEASMKDQKATAILPTKTRASVPK